MDYIELFEPVDEVQTARNVRNFFNKDLDKLLRMANEVPSFLRSPVIDDMPKSPSFKNGSEEILVNHFESKSYIAKSILIGVSKALNNCRLIHKQILIAKYLDDEYMLAGKTEDRGFYVRWYATQKGDTKTPTWLVRGNRLRKGVTMDQYNKFGEDLHNGKYNSIYSTGKRRTTAWHEIGHFVEEHNKDTLRISKEFVARRTKGEREVRLNEIFPGFGYKDNEVTLKDDFISPYIGKQYSDASEVLSIGLESIFEPGERQLKSISKEYNFVKITEDEEYFNLILGMLLKG